MGEGFIRILKLTLKKSPTFCENEKFDRYGVVSLTIFSKLSEISKYFI